MKTPPFNSSPDLTQPTFNGHDNYNLASYTFELPTELVAQSPPPVRGQSRLMFLPKGETSGPQHCEFKDIARLLPPNSLLIANNVQVVPARLCGHNEHGGKTELLLLTPWPKLRITSSNGFNFAEVEALAKPARRFKLGTELSFGQNSQSCVMFTTREHGPYGRIKGVLRWQGGLKEALSQIGEIPLPPYIHRPQTAEDARRYQTVYAADQKAGAVAAPTAGLHFTPELKEALLNAGHEWQELTLYVGYGTFSPIRCADIRQHQMHSELLEIPGSTLAAVQRAKQNSQPVVAVGTTSLRALEGCADMILGQADPSEQTNLQAGAGIGAGATLQSAPGQSLMAETNIFIYPGYEFKVVDRLITNFHLPESSLLLLVCAFAGKKRLLNAYAEAVRQGYRFFSYGDAMFI